MDISEEYIKMCEATEEIQKPKAEVRSTLTHYLNFEEGDYVYVEYIWCNLPAEHKVILIGGDNYNIQKRRSGDLEVSSAGYCEGEGSNISKWIWLPRQDQLQKIFGELEIYLDVSVYSLFRIMLEHWLDLQEEYGDKISSFEQGWLALVMDEKYGKKWNGETWTKK